MNILGWILAVCGFAGLIFGLRMMLKSKKMANVPFRKPSELAAQGAGAADAKGMVSTEGSVVMPPQPLVAPMSGQPCIGYEITIERKWEKMVKTQKGHEKRTGTSKVHGEYRGSFFQITDGAAGILVDATTEPDSEYEKTHSSTVTVGMMIPGMLTFGQMQLNTPAILDTEARTVAFVGTEKVIKPSQTMYALGQLAQGSQGLALATPKGMTTGKLIVHHKGREHLTGKTKRNMILGYAIGGVLFVAGVPMGIFAPHAKAATGAEASCESTLANDATCSDRVYSADGKDYTWTVAAPGTFSIEIKQPDVLYPIDAVLEVTDATGKQVAYNDGGSADKNAKIVQTFTPGTYKLNVRDFGKSTVDGGYSYQLIIAKSAAPAPEPVATAPAPVASAATAVVHTTSGTQHGAAHLPKGAQPAKPAPGAPPAHK